MNKFLKSKFLFVLLGVFLLMLACQFVFAEGAEEEEQITKVRIAVLPYFDCMHLVVAPKLGMDEELGLDFEFVPFTDQPTAIRAMVRGEVDVIEGGLMSSIPLYPEVPDLRFFFTNNQFKGFMVVGRKGQVKTFEELLKEKNGDFSAAQRAVFEQMRGKMFCLTVVNNLPTVAAMLDNVGMSVDDVEVKDFANPTLAANAIIRGVGDFYVGSLPQEMKLLKMKDQFVNVASGEVLGPAGQWFSNTYALEKYVRKNYDVILKLTAINYRVIRYMHEKQDETLSVQIDYLNEHAATALTLEDAKFMFNNLLDFQTLESSQEKVYNPDSAVYWKKGFDFYVKKNEKLEKIPAGFPAEKCVIQEEIFHELLQDEKLINWINSPL